MSLLVVGHSFARRLGDANAEDVFRRKMSVTFSNVAVKGDGRVEGVEVVGDAGGRSRCAAIGSRH